MVDTTITNYNNTNHSHDKLPNIEIVTREAVRH